MGFPSTRATTVSGVMAAGAWAQPAGARQSIQITIVFIRKGFLTQRIFTIVPSPFLDSASGPIWYFNQAERAKFSAPGAGQFGNSGRNFFIGPHYFELDASLLKRISINERMKLEIRADATNLTNTPSFAAPTTDITSSIFGRIRNSLSSSSRKIQIGAKIHF